MQSDKIILVGSGASIPFESEKFLAEGNGLAPELSYLISTNYSIGLNSFYKFGCSVTIDFVNDFQFYHGNYESLKSRPFVIVRHNPQLFTKEKFPILPNTLLLPDAKYYFGKDSWDIHYKKCLTCGYKVHRTEKIKYCPTHKLTHLMPVGFYHGHLAGLITTTLAIALGFKKIYWLGMDCNETNGKTHFYQDLITNFKEYFGVGKLETTHGSKFRTSAYSDLIKLNNRYYEPLTKQTDAKIYNVSLNSGIEGFEKIDYTTFYTHLQNSSVNQDQARTEIRDLIIEKTK